MTFSQRRALPWEYPKDGSSTATLWCAPSSCRPTVVYLSCLLMAIPAASFSLLPLSLHPGSVKCSESPTPYPISVSEDHQTLSLIMEGKRVTLIDAQKMFITHNLWFSFLGFHGGYCGSVTRERERAFLCELGILGKIPSPCPSFP